MNPTVSLVTEVEVVTKVATVDDVCHPMGISGQLRLQVSPHCCRSNEEIGLMDRR